MTLPLFVSPDLLDLRDLCRELMEADPEDCPTLRAAWLEATHDYRISADDHKWLAELDWRARSARKHAGRVEHAGPSRSPGKRKRTPVPREVRRFVQQTHPWCHYCGGLGAEIDHIWPVARGGSNDLVNLAHACRRCNDEKHARTVGQWREARLARGEQWPPPAHWPSDLADRLEALGHGDHATATRAAN